MAEKSLVQVNIQNFDEVIKNKDCRAILHKLINQYSSDYRGHIEHDDVESCAMQAAWEACMKYDESYNVLFTSFFYGTINNRLRTMSSKRKEKYKKYSEIYKNRISEESTIKNLSKLDHEHSFASRLTLLDEEDKQIIIDKFIGNMTNKEMATKYNFNNQETMRLKIKKILSSMASD